MMSKSDSTDTMELELAATLQRQRDQALDVLFRVMLGFSTLVMAVLVYNTLSYRRHFLKLFGFSVLYAALWWLTLAKRLGHNRRAWGIIFVTYLLGIYIVQMNGLGSAGSWFLITAPLLTFMLLGNRAGWWAITISLLLYLLFAVAHYYEWPGPIAAEVPYKATVKRQVLNMGASFVLVLAVISATQWRAARWQERVLERTRRYIAELGEAHRSLEKHARELDRASRQAQKRAWQLQAAAEVLQATRGISNLTSLLQEAVRSFHTQFVGYGVDRVLIYILPTGFHLGYADRQSPIPEEELTVRASIGETPPSPPGIVRMVLRTGEAALKVNASPPETELALPLRGRTGASRQGGFEGIIYIHTFRNNVFYEEDLPVLQTLADQLSIVIQNVILLQNAQEQLREMRTLYRQYTREIWEDITHSRPVFHYDRSLREVEVSTLGDGGLVPPALEALGEEKPVVVEMEKGGEKKKVSLALPIKVRDTVIGVVHAEGEAVGGLSREQITLAETLVSQLALALDSARLFQDAQRRAVRERLTGEVAARMRETLDLDTVIKTAAAEVRRALGLPEVVIRLAARPPQAEQESEPA